MLEFLEELSDHGDGPHVEPDDGDDVNDDNACTRTRNVYMHCCLSHTDQWLDHGRQDNLIHGGVPIHYRAHDIVADDRAHARVSAAPGVVRVRCDTNEPVNLNVACHVWAHGQTDERGQRRMAW